MTGTTALNPMATYMNALKGLQSDVLNLGRAIIAKVTAPIVVIFSMLAVISG
jgi:hypothetical protein